MAKRNLLSRRAALKSAAGTLFLAPLLQERRLEAQTAANPKRLIMMFTPDSHPPEWWPMGTGKSFTLQKPLSDFAGLESQMLFVRQLNHAWTVDNHHEAGMAQLFTGARFFDEATRYANGPSIDQILLKNSSIRAGTPIASVHLSSAGGSGGDKRHVISYSGPGQPNPHEENPANSFKTLFNGVTFNGTTAPPPPPANDALATAKTNVKKKILEVNGQEIKRLQQFLGASEVAKLQLHLDALGELQTRISTLPTNPSSGPSGTVGGKCEQVTTSGVTRSSTDAAAITKFARVQADLIVNAFTCDRTRVADYSFSFSGGHHQGLLGYSPSWHDTVAHVSKTSDSVSVGGTSMTTRSAFIDFDRFWAGHIAYLVKRLAAISEGSGTMLDNTLMIWGVESGTNHNHSPRDMQYLIFGGKNLGVQLGQVLQLPSAQSANKLLTSVMQAFGYAATGLGIEANVGPLAGVLA
ncbi:MAG: DUF1552 domain-containing protein [Myxococcota bacterium]